ncbi:MAG TPA: alpha/beta fold hydrolase, partial [Longimicrobiales bacterium]|nr:alpha/beta fold hydrolase [Longimicrobiales bacterium]
VTGFFIQPPASGNASGGSVEALPWSAPDYVDTGAFREVEVMVGAPPWELPGTLSLPAPGGGSGAGDGVPGMVLVHGSGPQDRDETIGPNKPFRDLAWGLASRGVVVLRYEKRTRVHGGPMAAAGVDLDAEVIDDALAAVDLLRARPEVDPASVFLLGHSLGGTLAPDIARRDGELAGVVILAGSVRPFRVLVRDQLTYLRGQPENASPEARARIDSLLAVLDRYEAGELADTATIMGAPVSYVRELEAVDPVETLSSLDVPALLLQGGRDYQVTPEGDFEAWRRGLAGRPRTTFHTYPDLSHLFTPGEGMATPTEYMTRPKHVAPQVVEDIASWIRETASLNPPVSP